jgi:hypothetical protein
VVAVASSILIIRYRRIGVLISVIGGWILLYVVFQTWHAPANVWDEDREDIAIFDRSLGPVVPSILGFHDVAKPKETLFQKALRWRRTVTRLTMTVCFNP